MAFCNQCGNQLGDGDQVCAKCGAPVANAQPQAKAENAKEEKKSTAQFFDFSAKILTKIGGKDITDSFEKEDRDENMAISGFCYITPFFFLPLLACPKSKLARHNANLALLILIGMVASSLIFAILGAVVGLIGALLASVWFVFGILFGIIQGIFGVIAAVVDIALFLFSVLNICACLNLKVIEIPFLSKLKIIK